jgi:penicillin-binding protein A
MRSSSFSAILLVAGFLSGTLDARPKERTRDIDVAHAKVQKGRLRAKKAGSSTQVGLTLDPRLQAEAERLLQNSRAPSGAIVMSDVRTGRILAWAVIGNEGDLVRETKYPAASLFKLVTAATLLEGGAVDLGHVVCFGGGERKLTEADVEPGCHPGDQRVAFEKALGKSINGVFARQALSHLQPADLSDMATRLGFGSAPPIDVPADRTTAVIPQRRETAQERLAFARTAAGFGAVRVSPLGALDLVQTVANSGTRIRLHVTGDPKHVPRVELGQVMSEKTATKLRRMLEVTTRSGTSMKAFAPIEGRPKISAAGKTGTLSLDADKRLISWFAGFAPSRSPEVAVSVLLANDERWWRKANEVARDMLDIYFTKRAP